MSEKKELKSEEIARFIPLFYYPLGLALFLLLVATSSMSKRVKVELPSVFLLFGLLLYQQNAEAGVLDFMELHKAKTAYESGDFKQSSEIYKQHAQATNNPQSHFNAGNSLYKEKKYDEALKAYESAHFETNKLRAQNYANIGNTNAKIATEESLKNALEAYEKSLELQEDTEVQENYEAVKKALKEEEKEQKEEEKDNKKEENKKNKDEKKEQQKQDEKGSKDKEQNSQKDEKRDDKAQESEEKSQEESSHDKKKNSDAVKDDAKNKEKKDDVQNSEKTKEDLKELEQEKKDLQESLEKAKEANKEKMSDAEEEKWIQQLNMNQNSYMYMLNNENKNEENTDEKPW